MKNRSLFIVLLFGILFSFSNGLIPTATATEKNEYLYFGDSSIFNPVVDVGDKIYWSFETRNDEFNVKVKIENEIISENKTSDSGIFNVLMDLEYHFLIFSNLDLEWFREGWIKIEISINTPLSTVPAPTDPYPIEKNDFLYFGDSYSCRPVVEIGDKIYWSFETNNDEFNVKVVIENEIISENKTSDSGIFNVQMDLEYHFLIFSNLDLEWFRDGWIKIEISINIPLIDDPTPDPTPDPTDSEPIIPGYNIFIIASITSIILINIIKKKR